MRSRTCLSVLPFVLFLATATGCDEEVSYIRVSVYATEGDCTADAGVLDGAADDGGSDAGITARRVGAFPDSDQLMVEVSNSSGKTTKLFYEHRDGDVIKCFDRTRPVTFSVSFDQGNTTSPVKLNVTALNKNGASLGAGMSEDSIVLKKGEVVDASVRIARAFAGCDPNATSGDSFCGADKTCAIECTSETATCVSAGTAARAQLCQTTSDCAPGLECLAYCQTTSICVKPCISHADCGANSFCTNQVNCGAAGDVPSGRLVCSVGCNAIAPTNGCPDSMYCALIGESETVDCVCRLPGQVGTAGAACTGYSDCAPGYMCVMLAGTSNSCRALCKLGGSDCASGTTCTKLQGYDIYGVCL